jgi:hypothetical protein
MELNQIFSINSISIHGGLHTVLCFALLFLLLNVDLNEYNVQRRVSISVFPLEFYNYQIYNYNSYLTALNLLNAFLYTKDGSLKAQGPLYNTSVLLYE